MFILPETQVCMTDASFWQNRHYLSSDKSYTAQGASGIVGQVQIVDFTVILPCVHQHGCQRDPILQRYAAQV
ncbi:hypothetical protein FX985_02831 [Pseudomonas extremaustralis]|uniref:Uncharacterized protein n=1 Tax=Pseudomonas extremaustralis TaxID=359110 RepID=A0A5M9J4R1_9PSED|nr:hypothetical protein FX985_02831 [Pseudomonas extremaustralis]